MSSNIPNVLTSPSVFSGCQCQCGVPAAELEGIKLDIVVLQSRVESDKQNTHIKELDRLRRALTVEQEKPKKLKKDVDLLISEGNNQFKEIIITIKSLENQVKMSYQSLPSPKDEEIPGECRSSKRSVNISPNVSLNNNGMIDVSEDRINQKQIENISNPVPSCSQTEHSSLVLKRTANKVGMRNTISLNTLRWRGVRFSVLYVV